jgi:hypothetical protein
LKLFETKAVAAGLCKQDMNRFYKKPAVNPAFKVCQPLPILTSPRQGKVNDRAHFPATKLDKNFVAAASQPPRGDFISLCKNFAFSNLL